MSVYSPFEQEVLKAITSLDQKVTSLDQKVSSLEGEMRSGFARLDDKIDDLRDETRSESRTTRVLLDQAFQHISDHLTHQDTPDFVPKTRYPRVS